MTRLNLFIVFLLLSIKAFPADFLSEQVSETLAPDSVILISQTEEIPELLYPASEHNPYKFNARQLIVPSSLIAVGSFGLTHWWKKNVNNPVKRGFQDVRHHKLTFDNYLLLAPGVAGYGLNLFGFKGLHNVADATIIYATAYILTIASVISLKHIIHSPRPNGVNDMSFPSGHTAIAFCGAELLRREYWHKSPWIGVAGYLVATGTAFMRLYNNAHWLNDVIAGAGIGILCAEATYWLYPVVTKTFFKKRYNANVFLAPAVSTSQLGLACSISL